MNDTMPPPKPISATVVILLATMFVAGLLLVYFVHPNRAPWQNPQAITDAVEAPPAQPTIIDAMGAEQAEAIVALHAQLAETQRRVETLETALATLQRAQITELETER